MPAAPVGAPWEEGVWSDTVWESGVWGDAGGPTEPSESINDVYLTGEICTDITVTGEI